MVHEEVAPRSFAIRPEDGQNLLKITVPVQESRESILNHHLYKMSIVPPTLRLQLNVQLEDLLEKSKNLKY